MLKNPKSHAVHLRGENGETVCGVPVDTLVLTEDPLTCRACRGRYKQTRPRPGRYKKHFVAIGTYPIEKEVI